MFNCRRTRRRNWSRELTSFLCNGCETGPSGARPSDGAASPDHSGTPNEDAALSPRPLLNLPCPVGASEREPRGLLVEALQGISFLTDQVTELRAENKKLKSELMKNADLQAINIAHLRAEVQDLHGEIRRSKRPISAQTYAATLQEERGTPSVERSSPPGGVHFSAEPPSRATPRPAVVSPRAIQGRSPVLAMRSGGGGGVSLFGNRFVDSRRPLLKGTSTGSGLATSSARDRPLNRRAVFVTRLGTS